MSNENLTHQQKLDAKQTEFTDGLSQGSTRYITATAPLPVPSFDLTKAIIHKDNQVISAQRREIQEENKRREEGRPDLEKELAHYAYGLVGISRATLFLMKQQGDLSKEEYDTHKPTQTVDLILEALRADQKLTQEEVDLLKHTIQPLDKFIEEKQNLRALQALQASSQPVIAKPQPQQPEEEVQRVAEFVAQPAEEPIKAGGGEELSHKKKRKVTKDQTREPMYAVFGPKVMEQLQEPGRHERGKGPYTIQIDEELAVFNLFEEDFINVANVKCRIGDTETTMKSNAVRLLLMLATTSYEVEAKLLKKGLAQLDRTGEPPEIAHLLSELRRRLTVHYPKSKKDIDTLMKPTGPARQSTYAYDEKLKLIWGKEIPEQEEKKITRLVKDEQIKESLMSIFAQYPRSPTIPLAQVRQFCMAKGVQGTEITKYMKSGLIGDRQSTSRIDLAIIQILSNMSNKQEIALVDQINLLVQIEGVVNALTLPSIPSEEMNILQERMGSLQLKLLIQQTVERNKQSPDPLEIDFDLLIAGQAVLLEYATNTAFQKSYPMDQDTIISSITRLCARLGANLGKKHSKEKQTQFFGRIADLAANIEDILQREELNGDLSENPALMDILQSLMNISPAERKQILSASIATMSGTIILDDQNVIQFPDKFIQTSKIGDNPEAETVSKEGEENTKEPQFSLTEKEVGIVKGEFNHHEISPEMVKALFSRTYNVLTQAGMLEDINGELHSLYNPQNVQQLARKVKIRPEQLRHAITEVFNIKLKREGRDSYISLGEINTCLIYAQMVEIGGNGDIHFANNLEALILTYIEELTDFWVQEKN